MRSARLCSLVICRECGSAHSRCEWLRDLPGGSPPSRRAGQFVAPRFPSRASGASSALYRRSAIPIAGLGCFLSTLSTSWPLRRSAIPLVGPGRLRSPLSNQPRGESELFHSSMGDLSLPKSRSISGCGLCCQGATRARGDDRAQYFFFMCPSGGGTLLRASCS